MNAQACLRDGFGPDPAFSGIAADGQGAILGYLLYHFGYDSDRAARTLHVADLYVTDHARGQGIGRALLARASEIAETAGAEELIWSVYRDNTAALGFYEALGAEHIKDLRFMKIRAGALAPAAHRPLPEGV